MAIPDHTHRRTLGKYLKDNFINYSIMPNAGEIVHYIQSWKNEIITYLTDAANEYIDGHLDKIKFNNTKNKINLIYNNYNIPKDFKGRPPNSFITIFDNAFNSNQVSMVTPLPPAPTNYRREWTGSFPNFNYIFVNTSIMLNADDIKNLYAAMMSNTTNGMKDGGSRHNSSKTRGNVAKMIWYTHKQNRLLAVSQCDPKKKTIKVIGDGKVNSRWHDFNIRG